MKQILFAILGLLYFMPNAQAQSNSQYAKNYKVCKLDGKYATCDANTFNRMQRAEKVAATRSTQTKNEAPVASYSQFVYVSTSNKENDNIKVLYDDEEAAYEGKNSPINDGVKKNVNRNINYLDESVDLPPVDGSK